MAPRFEQLELDRQLCFALYAASRAVVRAYAPLLDPVGITYPQYVTLLVLWEESDRAHTVGEIGSRLHLDSGTLTPLLKRLETLGYVKRERDPADERRVLVELTPEGVALQERVADVPAALFGRLKLPAAAAIDLRDRLVQLTQLLEGHA